MFVAKPEAERAGFRFWKPLVWDKRTIGMGYHYRARYEFILFFEKGKRRLNDLGMADVIGVPRIRGGYPAEKPPAVSPRSRCARAARPGELVADPFMGSGSVGVAAAAARPPVLPATDLNPEAVAHCRAPAASSARVHAPAELSPAAGEPGLRRLGSHRLAGMTGADYANLIAGVRLSKRFGAAA